MKLLNVGCGGNRPQDEFWWNLDCLREILKPGTPERINLDKEPRYVECDLLTVAKLPFPDNHFDGILLQHVLEHFDCMQAVRLLVKCREALAHGGVLVASVPDVDYFKVVHNKDTRDNALELFGESISGDWHDSQCVSFFEYALFHREHLQILNYSGLWALLRRAGFDDDSIWKTSVLSPIDILGRNDLMDELYKQITRKKFSAIAFAYKPQV